MSKKKHKRNLYKQSAVFLRENIRQYYLEKFFNQFLNRFEFEGLDYQQIAYIMRKFWDANCGTVAAHVLPHTMNENYPEGVIIFTPWTMSGVYNIYDYPTKALLINTRGVDFIPTEALPLDEEGGVCIGYIQKDRKGISANIEAMIEKLVDIECVIRTNLKSQKTPWLIGVTPENEFRMNELWDNLDSDDPKLFVSLDELQVAKALVSGAPYVLDKLEAQRQQVENEILTRLGINNVGIMQKKEHFTVDEVNSNNQQIAASGDEYIDCLTEWFTNIKTFLGYSISVKLKDTNIPTPEEDKESEDEEDV